MSAGFSEAFVLVGRLGFARGQRSIKDTPGLTRIEIDERWSVSINPHREEVEAVPPFHMAVEFNGFPAGIIGARGGVVAAGEVANEDTLCAALKAALEREPKP